MGCKGCGENKKLIKAHAIPESFFVGLRSEGISPKLVTDTAGVYPKKTPIGVYDKSILCRECEDKFQDVDDYAQTVLLQQENSHEQLLQSGKLVGYLVRNINGDLLKLFFISVLWRASISNQEFYSGIKLGSFEEKAKKLIWSSNSGEKDQFSFVLSKFTDNNIGRAMFNPHREKWYGVDYYRFYMFGYVVYIKVDERKTPESFKHLSIGEDGTLIIIGRDIHNSSELSVMISTVKKARN